MTGSTSTDSERVVPPHSKGIKVIVVGLGIGGLAAAVECHRKGYTVIGFEKVATFRPFGDSIGIASNAARVLNKWDNGAVGQELQSLAAVQSRTRVYDTAGRYLLDYDAAGFRDGEGYLISRGDVSMVMYEHAKSLGIDMRLGKKVADYWENNDGAGIIVDGETVEADCVVCSDGVKSIARKPVAGQTAILPPWDRCITRAWMDSSEVAADPKSSWILEGTHKSEAMMTYYGKGAMIALATAKRGTVVFWYCVHDVPEGRNADELFARITVDEMLSYIEDWEVKDKIAAVVRKTPPDNLADHGLVTCDPFDTWVSPGGRMILMGDAAHPFLPTVGQGGSQAVEDAATVAIALELAGDKNVPLALRTAEKLRHPRTSAIQRSDAKHNEAKSQIDWEHIAKDPGILAYPRPAWIFGHDCQAYAYEQFDNAALAVQTGAEYVPRNVGDGYVNVFDFKGSESVADGVNEQ